MRIKNGFVLREISGDYIAIPFGESYETQAAMISLNSTGAFLWQTLEEDCDRGSLCKALAEGLSDCTADGGRSRGCFFGRFAGQTTLDRRVMCVGGKHETESFH